MQGYSQDTLPPSLLILLNTHYTPPPPPECELCLEVDATKVTLTTDDNIIIIMVCIRLSG